jgi:hypothetical protein
MEPVLKEPTRKRTGPPSVKWRSIVDFLKAHPDEWGMVGVYSVGVAPEIRNGKYRAFLPEGFDGDDEEAKAYMTRHYEITTTTLNVQPKRSEVYIRWIP